jgi:hypothetical protein
MPSIVANGDDQTVSIVLDDFGRIGRSYRETDVDRADLETTITELLRGEYSNPVGVVASTPRKNGRRMCRKTSPGRSGAAAILRAAKVPASVQALSTSPTQHAGRNCRCHCAWCAMSARSAPIAAGLRKPSQKAVGRPTRMRLRRSWNAVPELQCGEWCRPAAVAGRFYQALQQEGLASFAATKITCPRTDVKTAALAQRASER